VSDADVVSSEVTMPSKVSSIFYKSNTDSYALSIKAFFERPIKVGQGNFSTGDTVSTFSGYNLTTPHDLIRPFTIRLEKLKGFLGFRATSVLKIVLNATRFQQGRYILACVPLGGAGCQTGNSQAWINQHISTLIQRTQLPHVEIDLNCDTEAEIRIPYISCANYTPTASIITDTTNQSFAVGQFMLFPYQTMSVGSGPTVAGFTLWHRFEDVELICPAIPQSGRFGTSVRRKGAPTDVEQKMNNLGLISTPLNVASNIFTQLTQIPGLSTYAQPAAWVTERLSKCASIFGWSRPADNKPSSRMHRVIAPSLTTIDQVDTSLPLSLSAQNCVTAVSGFSGTDIDEMDFKNFNSIYSFFRAQSWTSSRASGDELTTFNVNPNHYWAQVSGNGGKLFNHFQPLCFTAQYFQYWRGSIKFKIKIVKTEFHSGRFSVSFSPYEQGVTTSTATYVTTDYLHREVYDIRESSEVEFIVPFVSSSAWKSVLGTDNNIGVIYIHCVEPIVAPTSVSSDVTLLIEVAGGDDLSFAVPVSYNSQVPVFGITPQSADLSPKPNTCRESISYIGGATVTDDLENSAFCIGEHVSSWRSMLKMFTNISDVAQDIVGTNIQFSMLPFAWDYYFENAPPQLPKYTPDIYGTLCSIFAMSRGGVRIKMIDTQNNAGTAQVFVGNTISTTTASTTLLSRTAVGTDLAGIDPQHYNAGLRSFAVSSVAIPIEVAVPQYHRFHSRTNVDHMCNLQYQYTYAIGRLATRLVVDFLYQDIPYACLFRAGADDCNFGCFVSIPPMTTVVAANRV